jgi:hypothetical protein
MKFTDGYWLTRPQYQINSPQEVFDYKVDGKQLIAYAPYNKITTRNDELNLGMTTVKLSSPVEGVIGVKLVHFDQLTKGPSYELSDENPDVDIKNQ